MNRQGRRASDATVRRTGEVSATLLREQVVRLEQERQAMQDLLYAIVLAQGRVRVRKQDMNSLDQGCRLDVREVGSDFYLTLERSNMVVPGGVEGGKAIEDEQGGDGAA
jgi:hypothetical protein